MTLFHDFSAFLLTLSNKTFQPWGSLTSYFRAPPHKHQLLLWHWQEELGLSRRGGSRVAGCHHISGWWLCSRVLGSILPTHQPRSQALPRAGQLKVPPAFRWLCIPEIWVHHKAKEGRKGRKEVNSVISDIKLADSKLSVNYMLIQSL